MENTQSSANQDLRETAVQSQQVSSDNNKLFVVVAISVLLTAVITGSVVYFWQKSVNEQAINNLKQKISSLEEQILTMRMPKISPEPPSLSDLSLVPTINADVDQKTYRNEKYGFEFRYPSNLNLEEHTDRSIVLSRPFISDPGTYDENFWLNVYVEEKTTKEALDAYFVRKFCESIEQSAYTPDVEEAIRSCKRRFQETKQSLQIDGRNSIRARNIYYVTERLITVIDRYPNIIIFSLGESGEEGAGISEKAIETLDQILSTFKFTD